MKNNKYQFYPNRSLDTYAILMFVETKIVHAHAFKYSFYESIPYVNVYHRWNPSSFGFLATYSDNYDDSSKLLKKDIIRNTGMIKTR